ncbi:MAG: CDP-alcohol phosphatidyltransferase family protein [Ignavibacteria bacterium]|nr:CDP-alcohol phosphatidyltransferase family protein [Ignavibacteria bacterium]
MSIINQYKTSLKVIEAEEIVDLLFFRPLAFLFVKSVYRTKISPNQITMLSLFCGIGAGVSIAIATSESIFIAFILLIFWTVLDCADGQLARLKKNGTPFGRLLDGIADYTSYLFIMIGISIWGSTNWNSAIVWWIIVIGASLLYAWQEVLVDFYRSEYIANALGKSKFVESELEEFKAEYEIYKKMDGQKLKKLILSVYIKYSSVQYSNKRALETKLISPNEYIKANKIIIRLWNLNGTSTHAFVLIILAFFNRFDIFIWYTLLFGTVWTLLLLFFQKNIDRNTIKLFEAVPTKT